MEASAAEAVYATAKIDGHDKAVSSGEMDDKLDGALPDLLNCEDATAKRQHGIRFEGVSLVVRNSFRSNYNLISILIFIKIN